ncbi:NUDIX domain-containing protein [Candidatus Woesearchaeota archaeon]|nr:NUDIX domain-containing protein [Candidatus Woesearchaeota archaeon]
MSEEMIDVVDDEDNIVGIADRGKIIEKGLTHRTSFVIVLDHFKRFLIQKRSSSKKIFPGCRDLGAAETVSSGESYEHAAIRALEEELGIKGYTVNELTMLFEVRFRSPSYRTNTRVFKLMYTGRISIQTDEVDEIRNASCSEIDDLISKGVFAPDGALIFKRIQNGRID